MFNLEYLGHAGWLIRNEGLKVLCDPWFGPQGAFFGEWYPFPQNFHLFTPELLQGLDFIYISHIHDDHYDPWVLKQIDKTIPVFIPNFSDKTLLKSLGELGFLTIKEFKSTDMHVVKGVKITIIEDEGYLDADSCLLLDDGISKVLNLNDCHVDFSRLKGIAGEVDILLLQSSNAIWWPCAYDYDIGTKKRLGTLKRGNILRRTLKYSEVLNAKHVIPNAGPPVFLSDGVKQWNQNRRDDSNPFVLMDDAVKYLQDKGIPAHLVLPGNQVYLKEEQRILISTDSEKKKEIYDNYDQYILKYEKVLKNRAVQLPKPSLEELNQLVDKFQTQLKKLKRVSKFYVDKIDFLVLFDFKEQGEWIVDFKTSECLVPYEGQEYNYAFRVNPKIVSLLFRNRTIDLERYFLGCNFECSRNPDEYNEFLFVLLRHFDVKRFLISESLYAKRSDILQETFMLNHNGENYEVQKYCPHMYANLEEVGYVEGESFVCPLHGWKFNLKDGKCENKKHFCLNIKKEKV